MYYYYRFQLAVRIVGSKAYGFNGQSGYGVGFCPGLPQSYSQAIARL